LECSAVAPADSLIHPSHGPHGRPAQNLTGSYGDQRPPFLNNNKDKKLSLFRGESLLCALGQPKASPSPAAAWSHPLPTFQPTLSPSPHSKSDRTMEQIDTLKAPHRDVLLRAIANVLSSPIAKQTYAQIVDGLPLANVALDLYTGSLCHGHPLLDEHKELCPGVAEEAQKLCSVLDTSTLSMPSQVRSYLRMEPFRCLADDGARSKSLRDYESAPPGSPSFSTRLIELVARAVHSIAAWLYTQDTSRHKNDALGTWRPEEQSKRFYPPTFPATLFCHSWYRDYDQYPEGVADSVGYWAEARILGGVVVFDRRDPELVKDAAVSCHLKSTLQYTLTCKCQPDAIYIHPERARVIYRICRLLDSQKEELTAFLLSETALLPQQHCPLPILPSEANRQRVDPEQATETTGIFRDRWERRLRSLSETDWRTRDVADHFNYISHQDWREATLRAARERSRRQIREWEAQIGEAA